MSYQRTRSDIELSNGVIVGHRRMSNGANEVFICAPQEIADSRELSDSEWDEYCRKLLKINARDRRLAHKRSIESFRNRGAR